MAAPRASLALDDFTHSQQPHTNNISVFDDEFEEDYAESIHSTSSRRENPFQDPENINQSEQDYRPTLLLNQSTEETFLQARNSVRKPDQDLSVMRGVPPSDQQVRTRNEEPQNRPLSLVSSTSFASPLSPVTSSPPGPSHPYSMYPQNFAPSRSVSNATARSMLPASASLGRQGPAHPYNLYPQTISSEASGDGSQSNVVPIGFPGHAQQFHRRLGPEGEEQDIIGPHGHAEQLPPYSRYPDTYDSKAAAVGLLSATGELTDGERAPFTPVEMQERPPLESDAHFADAPDPGRALRNSELSELAVVMSEKPWRSKSWKEKRKTRLIGPLSVGNVLLTATVIVVITVICGGVIGGVLSRRRRVPKFEGKNPTGDAYPSQIAAVTVTTTRYVDATPIPTPTYASPLPTGTYQAVFENYSIANSTCLQASQQAAWSCDLAQSPTDMNLTVSIGANGQAYISLQDLVPNLPQIIDYGAQPINVLDTQLAPVKDRNNLSNGAAYQFQILYNKLVVIPESALELPTMEKRDPYTSEPGSSSALWNSSTAWWENRNRISSADQPWFCYWTNTFLEGFLFLDEDLMNNSLSQSASLSQSSETTSTASALIYSDGENSSSSSYPTYSPSSTPSPSLQTMVSSTYTGTSSADQQTGLASAGSISVNNVKRTSAILISYATSVSSAPSTTMPPYPRLIKVEERRFALSGIATPAICTRMSKGSDCQFTVVLAPDGGPLTVALQEDDPPIYNGRKKRSAMSQEQSYSGCYCEWWST